MCTVHEPALEIVDSQPGVGVQSSGGNNKVLTLLQDVLLQTHFAHMRFIYACGGIDCYHIPDCSGRCSRWGCYRECDIVAACIAEDYSRVAYVGIAHILRLGREGPMPFRMLVLADNAVTVELHLFPW